MYVDCKTPFLIGYDDARRANPGDDEALRKCCMLHTTTYGNKTFQSWLPRGYFEGQRVFVNLVDAASASFGSELLLDARQPELLSTLQSRLGTADFALYTPDNKGWDRQDLSVCRILCLPATPHHVLFFSDGSRKFSIFVAETDTRKDLLRKIAKLRGMKKPVLDDEKLNPHHTYIVFDDLHNDFEDAVASVVAV